jgi:hypothetical protein
MRLNLSGETAPHSQVDWLRHVAIGHAAERLGLGDLAEAERWCALHGVTLRRQKRMQPMVDMHRAALVCADLAERIRRDVRGRGARAEWPRVIPEHIVVAARRARDKERRGVTAESQVYFIRCGESGPIKIGVAVDPYERLGTLQVANHEELHLLATTPGDERVGREIQFLFQEHWIRGEWYRPAPELLLMIERLRGMHES